jgi:two-component sensor histidine kinase/CheY-like chemotaxis protein
MSEKNRLLLVEDEAIIALAEKLMLEGHVYLVETAYSGETALAKTTAAGAGGFDLVLMDIDLGGGMSGTEAAAAMLARRNLPIVFLTSHGESSMVEKVHGITRYGYVLKNSSDFVLLSSIEMAFDLFSAHRAAEEGQRKLKAIFSALPDLVFVIDRSGRYLDIEGTAPDLLYRDAALLRSSTISETFPDETARYFITTIEHALDRRSCEQIEYMLEIRDRELWFMANITPLDEGSVVWVARDISKQKAAEMKADRLLKEKELLLREMHHRIKNNMATIASMLNLQASMIGESEASAALLEARSRVHGMMELYQRLYGSGDFHSVDAAGYLRSLLGEIESSFIFHHRIQIESDLEEIRIDAKILFPLGIIVNELVINSIKYAFPPGHEEGQISLVLRRESETRIFLSIADNGIGMDPAIDPESSSGFGLTLVSTLAKQLGARREVSRVGGTRFSFSFSTVPNSAPRFSRNSG